MPITIAPQYTQRSSRWTSWKEEYTRKKNVRHQHEDADGIYTVWFYDGPEAHICTMWKGAVPSGVIEGSGYTQEQNDADKAEFEADYAPTSNMTLDPRNVEGVPLLTEEPRIGRELIMVTHDFCNPTTWYTNSQRVTCIMTGSTPWLTFSGPHKNWIDMEHGNMFDEDSLASDVDHHYSTSVWIGTTLKEPRDPFASFGGDYEIDHRNGHIIFYAPVVEQPVTASYSYATDSTWVLKPDDGSKLNIEVAEAQFGVDMTMNDSIEFQIWVYNPYDLPNKVQYDATVYKTVRNLIDEALGSYPLVKAFGGPLRGISADVYGFPFRYGTVRSLLSSQGVELRVRLKNDNAFSGSYATATFYCTVHDE